MALRKTQRIETEADRYWRDKIERRSYGAELAALALLVTILVLN